jgi:predicted site-specific integrase-resolvase
MARQKNTHERLQLLGIISPPSRVYTFGETMAILDVGEHTLLDLLHQGKLRGFRIPDTQWGRWKISEKAINEYVEGRRQA